MAFANEIKERQMKETLEASIMESHRLKRLEGTVVVVAVVQ